MKKYFIRCLGWAIAALSAPLILGVINYFTMVPKYVGFFTNNEFWDGVIMGLIIEAGGIMTVYAAKLIGQLINFLINYENDKHEKTN